MRKIIFSFFITLITLGVLTSEDTAWAFYYQPIQVAPILTLGETEAGNSAILDVGTDATPSVVSIVHKVNNTVEVGSGFIFTHDGYILTNRHVVLDNDTPFTVMLSDGSVKDATVVYRDHDYDIAILKINGTYGTIAALGNSSDLEEGSNVVAIGNMMGVHNNTISSGQVIDTDLTIKAAGVGIVEKLPHIIATDAYITPGFSGGPLIDGQGSVVGMNVATDLKDHVSFSIPINLIKERIATYL